MQECEEKLRKDYFEATVVPLRKAAADQAVQHKAQRETDFRFPCPATCCAVAQPSPALGRLWPWLTVSTWKHLEHALHRCPGPSQQLPWPGGLHTGYGRANHSYSDPCTACAAAAAAAAAHLSCQAGAALCLRSVSAMTHIVGLN